MECPRYLHSRPAFPSLTTLAALAVSHPASANEPLPWQMGLQPAATPVMERIAELHGYLGWVIAVIVLLVFGLLAYVMVRFNAKRHPNPATFTHSTWLEIAWTAVPVMILVAIAVPSFRLLHFMDKAHDASMTLKVVGHQWYWSYEYPDHGNLAFDAFMVVDDELEEGQRRLLETDTRVVVPVETTIRVLVTAGDVMHSWAVPSLGIKTDAVPGRLNETWMRISLPGTYYGQCSELCGVNHGFMPVVVEAVSEADFDRWVADAREAFAGPRPRPRAVAGIAQSGN